MQKYRQTSRLFRAVAFFLLLTLFPSWPGEARAFSVGEERQVGEKLLSIVRKEFKLLDDPDIHSYIDRLGSEIVKEAGVQYFDYHFFVIDNKEFNAFAAPSGLIFVHSGLIEAMDNEGELVGVLAHEVAHVTSRHIASRINKTSKVGIGTMALVLAGIALGTGPVSEALITGSMAAGASMNLKFSRDDEEEADRLAFQWMKKADRDPVAMESMLKKMRQLDMFTRGKVPPYLLTHPEPGRRWSYVQDLLLIAQEKRAEKYAPVDQFDFLRTKYRIMARSQEPGKLLARFQGQAAADGNDSTAVMARYGLYLLALAAADFPKARQSLEKVMAVYPDRPVLTADLGMTYLNAGDYQRARSYFELGRKAEPANDYINYHLAEALEQLGELDAAISIYLNLLEHYSDYSRLYYQLGKIQAAKGRQGESTFYNGMYSWYEGDAEAAKRHLTQAQEILPAGGLLRDKAEKMLAKIKELEEE